MSREIVLTRGKVAVVDDDDYDRLMALGTAWKAHRPKHVWYAEISLGSPKRANQRTIQMHRFILDPPNGWDTDHIDGDGLNNRKSNLRVATRSQNLANRPRCESQTGYRGVQPEHKSAHFIAQITVNHRRIWLGNFETAAEAARAYDYAARKVFGEFATLNFSAHSREGKQQ